MSKIFISYRRRDSPGFAGRICDHVSLRFGDEAVFRDVETLEGGVDFVEAINKAVGDCAAMILVVGPNWLRVADTQGRRRLDNPEDFVRMELAVALARKVRVIPVLVEGAEMPSAEELPEDLKAITRRQAIEITDSRFESDIEEVIGALESVLGRPSQAVREARSRPADRRLPKEIPVSAAREAGSPERGGQIGAWAGKFPHRRLLFAGIAAVFLIVLAGGVALIHAGHPAGGPVMPATPARGVAVAAPFVTPVHPQPTRVSPMPVAPVREPHRPPAAWPPPAAPVSHAGKTADAARQPQTGQSQTGQSHSQSDRVTTRTAPPVVEARTATRLSQSGHPQWPPSAAESPPPQWPPPNGSASDAPIEKRRSSFRDRIKRAVEKW